jgi:dolichol-phosphate mannosyltransferase
MADFRLLDRTVVDLLLQLSERQPFLRGLTQWVGFRACYVEYRAPRRGAGVSKFTFAKMFRLAADGIFSFSFVPLRFALYLGMSSITLTLLVAAYVTVALLTHRAIVGWSSLLMISSFFSGIQLVILGVVAEYIGRIFTETKRRPRYLAKAVLGAKDAVFESLRELVLGATETPGR